MKRIVSTIIIGLIVVSQSVGEILPKSDRQDAQDFTFKDLNGKDVALSNFQGKVVYLDMWGSWCRPCLQSMPKSEKLRGEFTNGEDVVFMYVAVNEKGEEKWKAAIKKLNVDGVNLISGGPEEGAFRKAYDTGYVPHYFLIDKDGKMADPKAKEPGKPGLAEDIRALLSE
jgi:thiol-disulfide isomerase/thioredoxin